MGHFAGRAVEAHDILAKQGISAKVLHCATPLGMDSNELFKIIGKLPVVTCEDHHVNTGIGSIVAMMAARAGIAIKLKNMGVTRYGFSGPSSEVMSEMNLDPSDIADAVKAQLK